MTETKKRQHYLAVLLTMLVCATAVVSMIFAAEGGLLGVIGSFFSGTFGFYGYMFFVSVFVFCMIKLIARNKTVRFLPVVWFFFAITAFSLFMQTVFSVGANGVYAMEGKTFGEYVSACYSGGADSFGGAVCGAPVKLVYDLIGAVGCYAVFIGILALSTFLFINGVADGKLFKENLPDKKGKSETGKKGKRPERVSGDEIASQMAQDSSEEEKNADSESKPKSFLFGGRKSEPVKQTASAAPRRENGAVRNGEIRNNRAQPQFDSSSNPSKDSFVKGGDGDFGTPIRNRSGDSRGRDGGFTAEPTAKNDERSSAQEILFGDIPPEKRKNNFLPENSYTQYYEEEKIKSFSADQAIPTAPKATFVQDNDAPMPPKILHEAQGGRRIDAIEEAYRKTNPVATDRSMRNATASPQRKRTSQRTSEPLHRDLLGYKMDMQEDSHLPPIINADEWNRRNELRENDANARRESAEYVRPREIDNRSPIINADEVIAKRKADGEENSDDRRLFVDSVGPARENGFADNGSRCERVDYSTEISDEVSDLSRATQDLIISSMDDFRRLKSDMNSPDSEAEYVEEEDSEKEETYAEPDIRNGRDFGAKVARDEKSDRRTKPAEGQTYGTGGERAVQMRIRENGYDGIFEERTSPYVPYKAPPLGLLPHSLSTGIDEELRTALNDIGSQLVQVLAQYNVGASVRNIVCGPSVALFEMELASGMTIKRVQAINDDLARNISAAGAIRIIPHIIGKNCFGLEVPLPQENRKTVYLRDVLESDECRNSKGMLNISLGINIEGKCMIPDLAKMPHLLIGGSTGSGKSVLMNSIILSLLYKYSPEQLRFILVDPKRVEFMTYGGMPHMLIPDIISSAEKAINAFKWLCDEMERRYDLFTEVCVKNIDAYNKLIDRTKYIPLPRIVLMVDELCELMSEHKAELEDKIKRLTQLARAAGIHLILATQRPSVDVITGVIKSNLPSRVALSVTNYADSRTILDQGGAEKLCQKGEMLFMMDGKTTRTQGPYVSDEEVTAVIDYISLNNETLFDEVAGKIINTEKKEESEEDEEGRLNNRDKDPLFGKALKLVVSSGVASISFIQRNFSIGFNRANRIFGAMQLKGYVAKSEPNKPGQVLLTKEKFNELYGEEYGTI